MTAEVLDINKQLLDISVRRSVRSTSTVGFNGAYTYNGFVQTGERDARLSGIEKYNTYMEMVLNRAIIGASVRYIFNLVEKPAWRIKPSEDSEQAEIFARRLQVIIDEMATPLPQIVRKASLFKFFGFDLQEWTARRLDNGDIGIRDIESRPQSTIRRWDLDDRGRVRGVIQRNPKTLKEVYIPRSKLVYAVDHSMTNDPEGIGLLRHCVAGANRLKQYELLEGVGYESDLRGIPVARAPLAALQQQLKLGQLTQEEVQSFRAPLERLITNHFNINKNETGLLLDSSVYSTTDGTGRPSTQPLYGFDLVRGGADGQEDLNNAIARVKHEIADVLGTSVLLLGTTQGSFALSRDKSNNLFQLVTSIISQLARTFDRDLIGTIWRLNGWPPEFMPTFSPESISIRDIQDITDSLKNLADAGGPILPGDPVINDVRRALGISEQPDDIAQEMLAQQVTRAARSASGNNQPNEEDNADGDT